MTEEAPHPYTPETRDATPPLVTNVWNFTRVLVFCVVVIVIPILVVLYLPLLIGSTAHPPLIASDPTVVIPENQSCEDYANRTAEISTEWEKWGFPPMRPNLVTVNGTCKFGRQP